VVAQVGVQKTLELTPGSKVNDLVDLRKRERIPQTLLIQACVINTHLPLLVLLWHNWIGYPVRVLNILDEASSQKPRQLFTHGLALFLFKAS
jgi:hypothetical protein